MRVVVNWGLCDGNGVCSVEAPTVFAIDDDDNLVVLQEDVPAELRPAVEAAARACPKRAITVDG
ncbi:ferredoxin [Capillimicrobium parvum]|uniref:Ferredoxin n=1 Tax=Capillimicrobium parvum TaxID=2884022 RepID=A0A9E6XRR8_9ACTN|nr:hypothetical protein DSM104329_00045 [Capillimicrobium parvum]